MLFHSRQNKNKKILKAHSICQKWCACKTNLHSNKNESIFDLCCPIVSKALNFEGKHFEKVRLVAPGRSIESSRSGIVANILPLSGEKNKMKVVEIKYLKVGLVLILFM